jgi:hypothetical protein
MTAVLLALACGSVEVVCLTWLLARVLPLAPPERRAVVTLTWALFAGWALCVTALLEPAWVVGRH